MGVDRWLREDQHGVQLDFDDGGEVDAVRVPVVVAGYKEFKVNLGTHDRHWAGEE